MDHIAISGLPSLGGSVSLIFCALTDVNKLEIICDIMIGYDD